MKEASLTVHTIVKNEDQWIWYALNSVLPHVAKILIEDTGSTDKTVPIIRAIKSQKIHFHEYGLVTPRELTDLRNKQLAMTQSEWFMLVDGDEVWPDASIQTLVKLLPTLPEHVLGVVVKARLPVGDLYHYQEEAAGRYHLLGKFGHYNIRAYRKKIGYLWQGIYPLEAYTDLNGNAINSQDNKLTYLDHHEYWHLRHLLRSSVNSRAKKLERGEEAKVSLPEVFAKQRPDFVPSPWVSFLPLEVSLAYLLSPVLAIKRKFERLAKT